MSLDGRFRQIGTKRELRVVRDECIEVACWEPIPVIVRGKEQWHCAYRLALGCPPLGLRESEPSATVARRRREWVSP